MKEKKKMPTWAIILIVVLAIGIIGSVLGDDTSSNNNNSNKTINKTQNKQKDSYETNKPFEFDNLEITISNEISFTTLNNQFSEDNGRDVVKVPITVKNIKDETHNLNMFYLKVFGTNGSELKNVSSYFMQEESVEFAGELMPNASYTKYIYFLYDGDGTYTIKLDNYSKKIELKLDIKK